MTGVDNRLPDEEIEHPDWYLWWIDQAIEEADALAPKVGDYGSVDLVWIGRQMAANQGREVEDEEAAEIGIYWYILGKMGRWSSAVQEGRRPSSDTIYDLGVYCRMALRVRSAGGWPNGRTSVYPVPKAP